MEQAKIIWKFNPLWYSIYYINQMKTPENYPISAAAGFHYCKVLSPARSMEWIYMGGLRKYMGIKN